MTIHFMAWKPEPDVFGEAAGLAYGERVLDLVYTIAFDKTFPWDVVDGCDIIASGIATTATEAKRAAEDAGRRAFFRAVA